jgi:hypothetical protein
MHGVRPAAKNRVTMPHTIAFPPIFPMLLLAKTLAQLAARKQM